MCFVKKALKITPIDFVPWCMYVCMWARMRYKTHVEVRGQCMGLCHMGACYFTQAIRLDSSIFIHRAISLVLEMYKSRQTH